MKAFEITGYMQSGQGLAVPVKVIKVAENAEEARKEYLQVYTNSSTKTVLRVREIYVNGSSDEDDDD